MTYSRVESSCEQMSCIDKRLTILLVACDSIRITIAAVHHEADIVAADDLSLDIKLLCVLLSEGLDFLITCVKVSVPEATRVET